MLTTDIQLLLDELWGNAYEPDSLERIHRDTPFAEALGTRQEVIGESVLHPLIPSSLLHVCSLHRALEQRP